MKTLFFEKGSYLIRGLGLALFFATTVTSVVQGQARVFVSGHGSDTNACTLQAPCRTFAQALLTVASGGEVVALDSAGYGPVNINKPVSIIAPDGVLASITSTSEPAVYVFGEGISVRLRGLSITGTGTTEYAVKLSRGKSFVIDRCRVQGGTLASIHIATAGNLIVQDSTIGPGHYGIQAGGGSAGQAITVLRCLITGQSGLGIRVWRGNATIKDTTITGCGEGVFADSNLAKVSITRSTIKRNNVGVTSLDGASVTIGKSEISGSQAMGLRREQGTDREGFIYSGSPASNTLYNNVNQGTFSDNVPLL